MTFINHHRTLGSTREFPYKTDQAGQWRGETEKAFNSPIVGTDGLTTGDVLRHFREHGELPGSELQGGPQQTETLFDAFERNKEKLLELDNTCQYDLNKRRGEIDVPVPVSGQEPECRYEAKCLDDSSFSAVTTNYGTDGAKREFQEYIMNGNTITYLQLTDVENGNPTAKMATATWGASGYQEQIQVLGPDQFQAWNIANNS